MSRRRATRWPTSGCCGCTTGGPCGYGPSCLGAPELAEAIRTADADTLRRRFLGSPPRVIPALLTWLTNVDYVRRFAQVAFDAKSERGVGIARFEPFEEGVAEVAVDRRWRRVGLATSLIELLARAALEREVHSFGASYLAENRPIEAMLAHSGVRHLIAHGAAGAAVDLDRAARRGPSV